ncbi:MAG: Na/Pi cotransporter family protein [Candidatus Latescibacteria bacterium]|jgi:phosphate:Na+ symporter|nr:Na/Pi cotransporter family protein [Candidatus Latescibacterota bacterium]
MDTVATNTLDFGLILMGLTGGLALFLFGMEQMTNALKIVAGDGMKSLLAKLTTNRFNAAFAGAFVTSVIQSSSVTTVLVVGFISAGLMTMSQSIGVIMGANIGTTITAQIVAFKVTHYALILVAVGFAMLFFLKTDRTQQYGHMIMGLGLIFFGMELMSNATRPLRSYEPFIELMQRMDNPLLGILVSAAFTGLIQSSSATTGVIIVLAGQGFITLEAGIALAFGANIGTCVTAMLAAIGKPREAVQAAFVHVIFNVAGVLLWVGFIDQLVALVTSFSPASAGLTGADRLAAESPRQIANAHTVFNVANTFLFIWFTGPMGRLVQRLVPLAKVETSEEADEMRPRHLDDILLKTPALAMDIVRMELGRLAAGAYLMVRSSLNPVLEGTEKELDDVEAMDQHVDRLHGSIITYLGRLSQENLTGAQSVRLYAYMAAANYLENIGDLVETNLVEAGRARLKDDFQISPSTQEVIGILHEKVCYSVEQAVQALANFDVEMAAEITGMKDEINQLASTAEQHLSQRLTAEEPGRLTGFRLESELVEYLKRVYYFSKRIAKVITEEEIVYVASHREADSNEVE